MKFNSLYVYNIYVHRNVCKSIYIKREEDRDESINFKVENPKVMNDYLSYYFTIII